MVCYVMTGGMMLQHKGHTASINLYCTYTVYALLVDAYTLSRKKLPPKYV